MTDPRMQINSQSGEISRISNFNTNTRNNNSSVDSSAFQTLFEQVVGGVKFSQHAQQRLKERNIQLDKKQIEQLQAAIDKASTKGAKESLVLMNRDLALIVSVTNRMVITAMDGDSIRENVFSNIDSAVII